MAWTVATYADKAGLCKSHGSLMQQIKAIGDRIGMTQLTLPNVTLDFARLISRCPALVSHRNPSHFLSAERSIGPCRPAVTEVIQVVGGETPECIVDTESERVPAGLAQRIALMATGLGRSLGPGLLGVLAAECSALRSCG